MFGSPQMTGTLVAFVMSMSVGMAEAMMLSVGS